MYNVLLAVDRDESRARAQAEAMLDVPWRTDEVHVTVLHCFTDNPEAASATQVGAVKEAQKVFDESDLEYTIEEASGEPDAVILDFADQLDADMICVSGRKRTPTGKALFGSVSQSVILTSDRPVLVVDTAEK